MISGIMFNPFVLNNEMRFSFQIFYLGDIWYIDVTQILILRYKQYHPALWAYISQ